MGGGLSSCDVWGAMPPAERGGKSQADLWEHVGGSGQAGPWASQYCQYPVWVMPGLRREWYGGGGRWSVLHLPLSLPQRPVRPVVSVHPTLEQLRSISGWRAPMAKVAESLATWFGPSHKTGKLWGRADALLTQPLLQLLDRGRMPGPDPLGTVSQLVFILPQI